MCTDWNGLFKTFIVNVLPNLVLSLFHLSSPIEITDHLVDDQPHPRNPLYPHIIPYSIKIYVNSFRVKVYNDNYITLV